jgi:cytokinin dehydrogenase
VPVGVVHYYCVVAVNAAGESANSAPVNASSSFTRPLFRLPEPDGSDWVYLFDVLTVSAAPGPDPVFASQMLARNREWFEDAREAGATRYPIGALEFSRQDWEEQYGPMWNTFRKWKTEVRP